MIRMEGRDMKESMEGVWRVGLFVKESVRNMTRRKQRSMWEDGMKVSEMDMEQSMRMVLVNTMVCGKMVRWIRGWMGRETFRLWSHRILPFLCG